MLIKYLLKQNLNFLTKKIQVLLIILLPINLFVIMTRTSHTQLLKEYQVINLFKQYDWKNVWENNIETGATLKNYQNSYILQGTSKNKTFGYVYSDIKIDFNENPELLVEVTETDGNWFILITDPNFAGGYLHIQIDTQKTGFFRYDLKKITGFRGSRNIQFQIGTSSSGTEPNLNLTTKFKRLMLRHKGKKESSKLSSEFNYNIPELTKDLQGWEDTYSDGSSTGATIYFEKGNGVVIGNSLNFNYGFVYREIELNLDNNPILEISISDVSQGWYLILYNENIPGGYRKIERYSTQKGIFIYNLKQLLKMEGIVQFRIALGVAIEELNIQHNINYYVKFNYIKFKSKETGGSSKDLDINAISIKNKYFYPQVLPIHTVNIVSENQTAKRIVLEEKLKKDELEDIKNLYLELSSKNILNKDQRSEFHLIENENLLQIQNKFIDITVDKKNGNFLKISTLNDKNSILINNGDYFWRLDLSNGESLTSKDFTFHYLCKNETIYFYYSDKKTTSLISIAMDLAPDNYIDFKIYIKNKFKYSIVNFSFPYMINFEYRDLIEFIFPYKIGITLNKDFYIQKNQLTEKYPSLFADFSSIALKNGRINIYGIQKNNGMFYPASLETGYNNYREGMGYYNHKYYFFLKNNSILHLPTIRMSFNPQIKEVIEDYKKITGIKDSPSLVEKLGSSLYEKLKNSILLKIDLSNNKDFDYLRRFIPTLLAPTLIHLVSYWPDGFDRNYPAYLPPDPAFGSTRKMASLCNEIRKQGHIVMPYTNPTWWNHPLTVNTLKKNDGLLIDRKGKFIEEEYNQSKGYVVNPYQKDVINRIQQTVYEFTKVVPSDILFEDQIGARSWFYAFNKSLPNPTAYVQGLLNITKMNSKKIPLFTEDGFDRLIPYESGFCNMSSLLELPPDPIFNKKFGDHTWEIFPLALYLAHDKIGFYQHNLSLTIFSDSWEKITWNLLYGHNLNTGAWISQWNNLSKDYKIASIIQKEIISQYFGKSLTDHRLLDKKVYLSQFENIIIIGNLSTEEYKIGKYTIAPKGFFVFNKEADLMAGVFTKFNGEYLSGKRIIILRKQEDKLLVKQLAPENTFICVPRMNSWPFSNKIEAYYGDKQIPFVFNQRNITFFLKYGQDNNWYTLLYNKEKKVGFDLMVFPQYEDNFIKVNAELLSFQNLNNVKVGLKLYLINSIGEPPEIDDSSLFQVYTKKIKNLKENNKIIFNFKIPVPKNISEEKSIWININVYKNNKLIDQLYSSIKLTDIVDIILAQKQINLQSFDSQKIRLSLFNYSEKKINGIIKAEIPSLFSIKKNIPFSIDKFNKIDIPITINANEILEKKIYQIKFKAITDKKYLAETTLDVVGLPQNYIIDIDPINLLVLNKKNQLSLILKDIPNKLFPKGIITITPPRYWVLSDFTNKKEINFEKQKNIQLNFSIKPTLIKEAPIIVSIKSKNRELIYKESYKCFSEEEATIQVADINNDKISEIILGNNQLETVITPLLGARILKIINRKTGQNQLYTEYPGIPTMEGEHWENWQEYGGLNDWWPSGWPGDVWNNEWKYKIIEDNPNTIHIDFYSKSRDNTLSIIRSISLNKQDPIIEFYYKFKNLSDKKATFFYNSHPDFPLYLYGGNNGNNITLFPIIADKKMKIKYTYFTKSTINEKVVPADNWNIILNTNTKNYIGQVYEKDKVENIYLWQGINSFTLSLLSKKFLLPPFGLDDFRYYFYIGENDWYKQTQLVQEMINDKIVEQKKYVQEKSKRKINTVAIIDFNNILKEKEIEYLTKTIPESISVFINNKTDLEVLETKQINEKLDTFSLNLNNFMALDEKTTLGKILDVDIIVSGSFLEKNDKIYIETKLLDVKTGDVIRVNTVEGNLNKDVFLIIDELAQDIINKINQLNT